MEALLIALASILASSTPLVFAGIGEALTERAGVINLSLDGTILLSAMAGFAVAFLTGNLVLGFLTAALIGALVALLVAVGSISLRQDQVAVGFVLTLTAAELSSFLGAPFVRRPGPFVPHWPVPLLSEIPLLGELFFDHNLLVYASFLLILSAWWWTSRSRLGLEQTAVGERPEAAFARGTDVRRTRYVYTLLGGALVGIAGAAFSLDVKLGWSHRHTAGFGWIALAIVIFGGWHPLKVALGAYLFGALRTLASVLQAIFPGVPVLVFPLLPFPLMILTLVVANSRALDRLLSPLPWRLRRRVIAILRARPPGALGTHFKEA